MVTQKTKVTKSGGWNFFQNPLQNGIKRYFFEVLQHRYPDNERIIEQISTQVLTESQYQEVGKLVMSIYESGYMKSIEDHKEQLSKLGYKADVVPSPNKSVDSIFTQEKSG